MEFVRAPGVYLGYTQNFSFNDTLYDCFYSGLQTPQYCVSTCFNEGVFYDMFH